MGTPDTGVERYQAQMRKFGLGVSWIAVLSLGIAPAVSAAVYRYVDDRGVIHFTNRPEDERYEWIPTSRSAFVERARDRRRIGWT